MTLNTKKTFLMAGCGIEEDTGASYGPFTGNPGLNISPTEKHPHNYFELFFDPSMYTRIAATTNTYARQRIRKLTGTLPDFYFTDFYSIFTRFILFKFFLCNLYFCFKPSFILLSFHSFHFSNSPLKFYFRWKRPHTTY